MSQDVKAVQELIDDRKKQKKIERRAKTVKFLKILSIHLLIVLIAFIYILTGSYRFIGLDVKGNDHISLEDIQTLIKTREISILDFTALDFKELESHPLIKTLSVDASQMNTIQIDISEYRVVASLNDQATLYLLENGTIYQSKEAALDVPQIVGYDETVYPLIADSLAQLKDSSLILMSRIIKDPKTYDENYSLIYMQDGIQVSSSFKGYTVLDSYERILKALNPEHKCLSIDEYGSGAYSFPCTLDSE